jgi:hypothetical protein
MMERRTLVSFFVMLALALPCIAQKLTIKIPPLKTSVDIEKPPVNITVSGVISQMRAPRGQNVLNVELLADLSDMRHNITMILRYALKRKDRCGDHISTFSMPPLLPMSLPASWCRNCTSSAGSASGCSARSGPTSLSAATV